MTITNSIRTLNYYDYIEINDIKYIIANNYSFLNSALLSVLLDECLPENIHFELDYCNEIYFQSYNSYIINSMNYNVLLLCRIK